MFTSKATYFSFSRQVSIPLFTGCKSVNMPRATRSTNKQQSATEKAKPYSTAAKPSKTDSEVEEKGKARKSRTGKDSHLYTDDNPSTTLHGTGFKDAATAEHTIELVSRRSLLYQFQTINTMYHRAAHHPSGKTNNNIQAAMKVFRKWLDETYPTARAAQQDYPLLKKDVVVAYLPVIKEKLGDAETDWATLYSGLPKGKRLANTLMDETKPAERDLAVVRQNSLAQAIEDYYEGKIPLKKDEKLWEGDVPSFMHLKLIAYAFSPVKPDDLLKRLKQ